MTMHSLTKSAIFFGVGHHAQHRRGPRAHLRDHARAQVVAAAADCAAGCGVFADSYACVGAVSRVVPVTLVIRGCPPTPMQLLQGLLCLLGGAGTAAVNRPAGSC